MNENIILFVKNMKNYLESTCREIGGFDFNKNIEFGDQIKNTNKG